MKPALPRQLTETIGKFVGSLSPRTFKRSYINSAKKEGKILLKNLMAMKKRNEKISMITAYDYNQAVLADSANIDTILVGDSCANVMMGLQNTNQITLDAIIHHSKAVTRGAKRSYVIGDMPFGSYLTTDDAIRNAGKLVSEGGVSCVKLEGYVPNSVKSISRFIPVCSHLGLLPQTADCFGTRGRTYEDIIELKEQSLRLQDNGASFLVLEKVCSETAAYLSDILEIPTIGIGSGPYCNGQVLVWHDFLGLNANNNKPYKFVKEYNNISKSIINSIDEYIKDVQTGKFPSTEHSYYLGDKVKMQLIDDGIVSKEFFDNLKEGSIYYTFDEDGKKVKHIRQILPYQTKRKYTQRIFNINELIEERNKLIKNDIKIIFIPFLGGLHKGHLDLVEYAIKKYKKGHDDENYQIWTSLFLNPKQFNEEKDLETYPYNMDDDIKELTKLGVDLIFTPNAKDVYPNNDTTGDVFRPFVDFNGLLDNNFGSSEAIQRPGHFRGVGTIVTKLFAWIRPNKSIFGQKDFIQSIVIKKLANEFFIDNEIIVHPTVREENGLAMSSRNNKLTQNERVYSHLLYECLCSIGTIIKNNKNNILTVKDLIHFGKLYEEKHQKNLQLEYIQFHDYDNGLTLEDDQVIDCKKNIIVISIAGKILTEDGPSQTRLIDNIVIGKENWDFKQITDLIPQLK